MKTPVHGAVTAALGLAALVLGLAGVRADPPREAEQPILPDEAALALVKEANAFIQEPLGKARAASPKRTDATGYYGVTRANALLIALVAQNRMRAGGPDAGRMATLQDLAVRLAEAVRRDPPKLAEVLRLADLLNRYPDLKADPNAPLEPVQLKDTFTHDEISILFGGCSGQRWHAIDFQVLTFARHRLPYTRDELARVELLAYKVALIGGFLREFDADFVPPKKPDLRAEWVRLAGEVEAAGWRVAARARDEDMADVKERLNVLHSTCTTCHGRFRH